MIGTSLLAPSAGLIDLLNDAVFAVDVCGRIVFASAACKRTFGYTPEEMVGKAIIDMVAPEDRARTLEAAADVMLGAAQPNFENCYLRKDGTRVHIMWSARWSESDRLRIAVARDISERWRGESMRAAMYAISEAAHAAKDLLTLFRLVHQIVNELLPAPGFSIALCEADADELSFPYNVDQHGQPAASSMPGADTLYAHVANGGGPLLLGPAKLQALPAELRAAAESAAPYWLGVPLKAPGGTIGALVVKGAATSTPYTEADQELLQFVAAQVATAIERMQLHEQLKYMAQYDALTGLPNRQLFLDRLESALVRAGRNAGGVSLLFLDLDKFKQVNDLYGHAAGDLLLHEVAQRIKGRVREADTVARIGGDEFVVLLETAATPGDATRVADQIKAAMELPVTFGNVSLHATLSIGVAEYPEDGRTAAQLLKYADSSMYAAKRRRGVSEDSVELQT
jgi:diguanylate cyclase (GGDEF)-like protein/PAS domain S-box-containing protein